MKDDEQNQRRDKWRKLVDEYLDSDMTQKSFCEKRNLNLPQFVYYYGQFKPEKDLMAAKPSFLPVKMPHLDRAVVTSEIKLSLPNGFQCSFPSHTDTVQIKQLVEALLSC